LGRSGLRQVPSPAPQSRRSHGESEPQWEILVPSLRTDPGGETTREVAELSADSHRRRAASTMLSPVPELATFSRSVARFRARFLLLAAFFTRRFTFFAAIAAAPCGSIRRILTLTSDRAVVSPAFHPSVPLPQLLTEKIYSDTLDSFPSLDPQSNRGTGTALGARLSCSTGCACPSSGAEPSDSGACTTPCGPINSPPRPPAVLAAALRSPPGSGARPRSPRCRPLRGADRPGRQQRSLRPRPAGR
jgi:hypothetical protein